MGVEPRLSHALARIGRLHPLTTCFVIAVAALVLSPLASLVHIALKGDAENWGHLAIYVLPAALFDTLLLLAGVAVVTALAGISTAWIVTTFQFPGRNAFTWLLPLPLAIPTYIVAYIYVDIFDALGPVHGFFRAMFGGSPKDGRWFINIRSLPGAIFVMGFVLYPYVYLAARAMFQTQSAALIEMARMLGASRWRAARDITLPLARPAIAAGLALALLETLNDIGASEYLGIRTLTLSIFTTWLNRGSLPGAAQIACILLLAIAGLIAVERYGRYGRKFTGLDKHPRTVDRIVLRGAQKWIATAICVTPVAFGFLIPVGYLAHETVVRGLLVGFDPDLVRHTFTAVSLAAVATAFTLMLGFGVVIALRLTPNVLVGSAVFIAGLGYAVPGTVLALGLLSPLIAVDEAINWLTQVVAGMTVGLVIVGSGAAIVIVYVVRFLAIATGLAQAGFDRISTELDDAARIIGARPFGIARHIHLPLSRPALWGAALLIFVDCLKELPATLLLRPLNVETLSTYIYQFASRGNFEEGALAALLIVVVGILPVIWMVRYADLSPMPESRSPCA